VCVKTNVHITAGYVIHISDERRPMYLHSTQKYIYIFMRILIVNEKRPRNVYAVINIRV